MACVRSKAVALLAFASVTISSLASFVSAAEAPAPAPASGASDLSLQIASALFMSSVALLIGALHG
ncbi:hypothetical protein HPP92_006184 [Vanilla planifolia]|uniref:Uncharacterized protein n=1 Tax=Vanilla planifolia TaxID=51239 RepID=A0A835RVZ9_VANPL|nr:hypothetical protein HPP92_026894 [Vanilla planifolia]KAG0493083.1 hypothetical protein HPP92_006481 [Vanilla planifolia]KAG0495190.1 hypothetical protein HPP92_006184 [Vanilla planifolia]